MADVNSAVARINKEALEVAKEQACRLDMKLSEYISMAVLYVAERARVKTVSIEVEKLCIDGDILN